MPAVTGWWTSGRTLAERGRVPVEPAVAPDRRTLVRLERWRSVCDLPERLAHAGLDEARLLGLLAGGHPTGRMPRWARDVERLVATAGPRRAGGLAWQDAFGLLVEPFVADVRERLPAGVLDGLRRALIRMAVRVLVLELNVAAVTGRAGSVEEFVEGLDLAALYAEYPVLARMLWQRTKATVTAFDEMMGRFAADRAAIGALLGADPGPVTRVEAGLGDTHAGRSVAVLHCANGTAVVYRPRPPAVHVRFNHVVEWFGGIEPELAPRTVRVLDRGEYGWAEFVVARPATALRRYFRRYGALVALLYLLDGTDQHFENVVACGDQPVLVDLETLFHPPRPGVDDPAAVVLASSVLRTCLLPQMVNGFDLSGLGGEPGAALPDEEVGFSQAGTTRMRLVRERGVCAGAENRPHASVDPGAHVEDVVAGFRRAYEAIARHRDSVTGLLAGFHDVGVRVVVRHTRDYARLLDESTHPDVLRDALDRDRLFDHLWPGAEHEQLVEHEIADLWAGDVPLFSTTPASRDLVTSTGTRVADVLAEPGVVRVARKIAAMGPADLRTQEWVVRAAFATRSVTHTNPASPTFSYAGSFRTSGEYERAPRAHRRAGGWGAELVARRTQVGRLLAAARSIGDELLDTAHDDGTRVNWLGLRRFGGQWVLGPLPQGLPDGRLGVALFLAQLADVTGEPGYAKPVPRVVASLVGTSTGLGGIAYALARLGAGEVSHWVDLLAAGIDDAQPADAAAMRAVHRITGLPAAADCVERLRHLETDFAWCDRPRGTSDHSLCHGELAESGPARIDRLLASIERTGPRCATPGGISTPGLVDGLAGIGHGLLRLAAPDRVPSVLRFE